jgi:hypothetical protein
MQSEFSRGELVRGLRRGITTLAMSGRAPRTLHAAT